MIICHRSVEIHALGSRAEEIAGAYEDTNRTALFLKTLAYSVFRSSEVTFN